MGWLAYLILAFVAAYILSVVTVYYVLSYALEKRFEAGD